MDSNLLEASLQGATVVVVSPDGTLPASVSPVSAEDACTSADATSASAITGSLILDLRRLESVKAVETLRDELTSSLRSRVVGADASGSRMGEAGVVALLSGIVVQCRGLVELNLSYIELSHKAMTALLDLYDVVKSGYCNIKILNLNETNIDFPDCTSLLRVLAGQREVTTLAIAGNMYVSRNSLALMKLLAHPHGQLRSLDVSNCYISGRVMKKIAPAISAHPYLRELRASSNHLGDDGVEGLFSVLCLSKSIEVVTLNSVQLRGCKWSRHLRVMETLHTLILSYNSIDDLALQTLCTNLLDCGCVRYLNISYNSFGHLAVSLGGLITDHKGLLGLDISGNNLSDDTVESIKIGLEENKTLRYLDASYCGLRIDNVTKLCSVLSENFLVSVRILGNPVPLSIQEDARAFAIKEAKKWRAYDEAKRPSLNAVSMAGIAIAEKWRAARLKDVREDKIVEEISREVGGRMSVLGDLEGMRESSGSDSEDDAKKAVIDLFDGPESPESKASKKAAAEQQQQQQREHGEGEGEGGDSDDDRGDKEEAARTNNNATAKAPKKKKIQRGKKKGVETLMAVLYGRATESIGAVTIIDSATYADVRALIRPLIESYYNRLKEVDGWQGKHVDDGFADKSDAFFIPDPEGNIVPRELEFSRIFMAEHQGRESVTIRPRTWMVIPKAGGGGSSSSHDADSD